MTGKSSNNLIKVFFIVLVLAMMLGLTGCRESTALVQIIHDQDSAEVDHENKNKVVNNVDDSDAEDDQLAKKKDSQNSKSREQIQRLASAFGNADNEGEADRKEYSETAKDSSNSDTSASSGDEDSDKSKGKGNSSKHKGDGDNDSGDKESDNSSGEDPDGREVYDGNDQVVQLPKEVNTVVAAGDAGVIAQMLGGKGILVGTSKDLLENDMAQTVFASQGLSQAQTYWSGSGDSPMSDSNFNKLLAAKPDCCLYLNGSNSFSSSQLSKLKTNKIACVVLPALTSEQNIEKAVTTVGDVIGDRSGKDGGKNAKTLAKKYSSFCDSEVKRVKSEAGGIFTYGNTNYYDGSKISSTNRDGKYTLYISGWDDGTFRLTAEGTTVYRESGYPVVPNGFSKSPMSYYMSVAGVCNYAANLGSGDCKTYAGIPVNINTLTPHTSGTNYFPQKNESFIRVKLGDDDTENVFLGMDQFPAVVVDSQETYDKLNGSYMWQYFGTVSLDSITDYGFISEDGSTLIHSYIEGDYQVYVNPAGIDNWADGSVESILEAPWAAWQINGQYEEDDMRSDVEDFYKKFYDYELSDDEIDYILAGKQ